MSLECLKQYLVVPEWCSDANGTVVNHNDAMSLSAMGITSSFASAITSADIKTGREVIATAMNQAYQQIYENILSGQNGMFRLDTVLAERSTACTDVSKSNTFLNRVGGTQVLVKRMSQYALVRLKSISVYLDQDTPVDVTISDGLNNTMVVTVNKNQTEYAVDFVTDRPLINITFPQNTKTKWFSCPNPSGGCAPCAAKKGLSPQVQKNTSPIEFRGVNGQMLGQEGSAYGVIPSIELTCSFDSLICKFAKRCSIPFAHFVVANAYKMAMINTSKNLTIFSVIRTMDEYKTLSEMEFKTGLSYLENIKTSMFDYINKSGQDICVNCTGYSRATYMP